MVINKNNKLFLIKEILSNYNSNINNAFELINLTKKSNPVAFKLKKDQPIKKDILKSLRIK